MTVKVTNVREQNTLNRANQIVQSIILTYFVDQQGPFTLVTNQADLNSGAANTQMQNFANTLGLLPGLQG